MMNCILDPEAPIRVLIIEDDAATAQDIASELEQGGARTRRAASCAEGVELALLESFDAITLDRLLPDGDGLDVVRRLRADGVTTPVLMISALSDVDERIKGLRAGGDDYLIKPFSPEEMAARLEVLVRRSAPASTQILCGRVRLDLIARTVGADGREVQLQDTEFRLLEYLMRNSEEILTRRMIFEQVWGYYFDPGDNLINVHIGHLRRKLEEVGAGEAIETVRKKGYRFVAPV